MRKLEEEARKAAEANQQLWEHIKTNYPDMAKFIQELKKAGFTLERPVLEEK